MNDVELIDLSRPDALRLIKLETERRKLAEAAYKAMKALNLYPLPEPDKMKLQLIKTLPGLISQFTIDPKGLQEKFSFFNEILPIIEEIANEYKYK
ncbi:MAG: hypothetical protein PHS33_08495 [Candidatus Omnitrophica bacterium]|nr:hypothetical protein [Candidatus Omnitrophota bacterium]